MSTGERVGLLGKTTLAVYIDGNNVREQTCVHQYCRQGKA